MKLVALAAVLLAYSPSAHAISACGGRSGWSSNGAELPPHAQVVFWSDSRNMPDKLQDGFEASIDGKVVPTKVTQIDSAPNKLFLIEIDSNATGKLKIGWPKDEWAPKGAYTIAAKPTYAKTAHATTSRFHEQIPHSTVREVFDGLELRVDVPAMRAHVKMRRDAKAAWFELDAPVYDKGLVWIGELGCAKSYNPQLLEAGVDIDVTLYLPDHTAIGVDKLTHVSIKKP